MVFAVVFGLFVLAIIVWAVLTVRWAIRRDKDRWTSRRTPTSQPSDPLDR